MAKQNTNIRSSQQIIKEEEEQEQKLSQKMSQLSTQITTQHAADDDDATSLFKEIHIDLKTIPDYLTMRNKSFQPMLKQLLVTVTTSIPISDHKNKIEELRKITLLIYKTIVIQTYRHLWTYYLKAGVGQLIIPSPNPPLLYATNIPIWSKEIKTMVQTTIKTDQDNEYESCLNFIHFYLDELEKQLKKYQHDLHVQVHHFKFYTIIMQKHIERYLQQNLTGLRRKIEHQIELIHYDYHIHAIKLAYLSHQLNPFQEQMFKDVCVSQYEQETAEQEFNLLKQQILYYTNAPNQSFQQSTIASCSVIDAIPAPTIRHELCEQYQQAAEHARAEIFQLYIQSAEQQRHEYKKKHDQNTDKIFSTRRSLNETEKLPNIMIDLIILRCQKISERIQCIYKFKTQFHL